MKLMNVVKRRVGGVFLVALALVLTAALYLPFSSNPLVFDDLFMFTSLAVYNFAQEVYLWYARSFPYFSLGLVHVLSDGDLAWNRYVNLALHCAIVLALYFLLARALERVRGIEGSSTRWFALIACLWVALNPLAVYAVAYLIQRTILLATLFGILSTTLYLRAQQQGRNVDLISAAAMAAAAVLCKEHAILLPAAAVALTPLVRDWSRVPAWRAAGYLALCLPAAIWTLLNYGMAIVGTTYETYSGQVISQVGSLAAFDFPGGTLAMSAATQVLLFWKYLFLWIVPNPHWLSADLRIDFARLWSGGSAIAAGFAAFASLAVLLGAALVWLRARAPNKIAQLSAVLLFAAIPFLLELSVVRVQEPFVLYRSYLWMPAYALLLSLVLIWSDSWLRRRSVLSRRVFWSAVLLACAALFPLAQDRLRSFSSEEALWHDAMRKLPRPDVPGADRIYYNLAGEAYKRKDFAAALKFSEQVVAQNPEAFHGYLAKGTSFLALGELDSASIAFDQATARRPPAEFLGYIEFKRCAVFEARGEHAETIACIRRSAKMGYEMARFHLKMRGLAESE